MQFTTPLTDIIKQRISVRTYTTQLIEPDTEARLKAFLASHPAGPFQTKLRFELVTAKPDDADALKGLGTYGQIKHPAGFIIGAMATGTRTPEDFGYAMEQIILYATDLGLGTCWLGGSFQQSRFAQKMDVKPDETVPAVTSIGYPADTPGWRDRFIHLVIDTKKRFPWETLFFKGSFTTPLTQTEAGAYAAPFDMVRSGPSANNKQPWRIVKAPDQNTFHFYVQRASAYAKQAQSGKLADLQRLDIGIAMCHFELTAREQGLTGTWQAADPGLTPLPPHTAYIASWQAAAH